MGNTSSMLTQYDIEEVQEHCNNLFSQQEIVSLYQRFCQLDRNGKGFISADEFLLVPELATNPLSQLFSRVYDSDCNGKVSFNDILEVLRDMSGSFISDKQREVKPKFNQFSFSVCVMIEGQGLMIWIEILVIGVH